MDTWCVALLKHKYSLCSEEVRNCFLHNLQSQGRQESVKGICFVPCLLGYPFAMLYMEFPRGIQTCAICRTEQKTREEFCEGRKRKRK
jgi:hypothetical protein